MEKKKSKMASKTFDDKPILDALQTVEKRVNNLEKDMGELISKVSAGFTIIDNTTSDITKIVNKICKRFGIKGL